MDGRSTSTDSYRYAYNGMEMDNEVSGSGNSYTTEFRQYDSRLGRWKSLDPLMGMFPSMSPYVAFDNNPVYYTDIYGLSAGNGDDEPSVQIGNGDGPGKYRVENGDHYRWRKGDQYVDKENGVTHTYHGKWKSWSVTKNKVQDVKAVKVSAKKLSFEQKFENFKKKTNEYRKSHPYEGASVRQKPGVKEQELAKVAGELYDPVFSVIIPGRDIVKKMIDGEEITFSEVLIEGLAIIPIGKIVTRGGKLIWKSAKGPIDITDKILKIGCFVGGTKISTEKGLVNIEEIQVGDNVWAFNDSTGNITLKVVENTVIREIDHLDKLIIGIDTIYTTDDHPFWVSNSWKAAKEIVVGDTLTYLNGEQGVLRYKERIDTAVTVYNFAVIDYHSYFVGEQEILVHNNNPCATISKKAQDIYNNISTKIRGDMGYVNLNKIKKTDIRSKDGYTLSATRGVPHADDAVWKLYKGKKRIATLDSKGKIIR